MATTSAISLVLPRFAETLAIGTEPIGTEPIGMSCSVSGGTAVSSLAKSLPWSSIGTDPIGTEPIGLDWSVVVAGCWTTRSKSAPASMWLR